MERVIKKIERPGPFEVCNQESFTQWFDTHIEPINQMIEDAVEVVGSKEWGDWTSQSLGNVSNEYRTHKALLINIEPIKKETAEDVLRDLIEYAKNNVSVRELTERARKVLEGE